MKILIDTNIILEVILQRENFDVANHLEIERALRVILEFLMLPL